jgi:hypothetical protein
MEEGTIMNENEPYWCFTISPLLKKNNNYHDENSDFHKQFVTVFGCRNPDLREDWFHLIEKITSSHLHLVLSFLLILFLINYLYYFIIIIFIFYLNILFYD